MMPERSWQARLARRARPHTASLAVLLVIWIIQTGIGLLKPWPLKIVIDYALTRHPLPDELSWISALPGAGSDYGLLLWMAASTLIVFLLGWLTTVTGNYVKIDVGGRMMYGFAAEVFSHIQRLSLRFHNQWPTGDMVKRVAVDCRCIQELLIDVCLPAVTAILTLAAMVAVIWSIDPPFAILALFVMPILVGLMKLSSRRLTGSQETMATREGEMMSNAEQALTGLPIVQAFGVERRIADQFAQSTRAMGAAYLGTIRAGLQFKVAVDATIAVSTAILLSFGGRHVLNGQISLGDLLLLVNYLAAMYSPLATLSYLSMSYASASARARRVFEIVDSNERVIDAPGADDLKIAPHGGVRIQFENVAFAYVPEREVLHGFNLEAQAGSVVALVGPTGAGKTTVVSLILRLFDPSQGRILFDGVDFRAYTSRSVRENVSVVLQNPFVLPMTVAENIAYARPGASREDIVAAARAAHADEFIESLPAKYDTVLGEQGSTLSGGQRQRLAIARAFLKDAAVLILDEPTSALDTQTERLIVDALRRLMTGRTTFIIGHRLSTVRDADQIVVLDGGRVVERGTHSGLVAAGGAYSKLYSLQAGSTFGETHAPPALPANVMRQ